MRKVLLFLLLLAVPVSLFAQDDDWRNRRPSRDRRDRYTHNDNMFEFTPFIGYRYGGTIYADTNTLFNFDADVASHANFGLNFGIPIANGWKIELGVDRQNTHFTEGGGLFDPSGNIGGLAVTYYQGSLIVPFARSRNATPYFSVGAGIANLDPDIRGVSADNRFAASAAIGVKVPISPNAGFRLEEKGYFTSTSNNDYGCYRCGYGANHDLYQGETNFGVYFKF
jgi:hypothetical protein